MKPGGGRSDDGKGLCPAPTFEDTGMEWIGEINEEDMDRVLGGDDELVSVMAKLSGRMGGRGSRFF
jgi:hypothetical protein